MRTVVGNLRIPVVVAVALLCAGLVACGKDKGTDPDGPGQTYETLAQCDTMNWLGLHDSLSCPKSGGLCPISGLGKVGVNVCLVDQTAWVWTVITGVSFGSEARATLNDSIHKVGLAHGELKFSDLKAKNKLKVEVEYKEALNDSAPTVFSKTYLFVSP